MILLSQHATFFFSYLRFCYLLSLVDQFSLFPLPFFSSFLAFGSFPIVVILPPFSVSHVLFFSLFLRHFSPFPHIFLFPYNLSHFLSSFFLSFLLHLLPTFLYPLPLSPSSAALSPHYLLRIEPSPQLITVAP